MQAWGWAIVVDGKIAVDTVYPTRRGAILNWLVQKGVQPSPMWDDAFVEAVWARHKKPEVEVIEVLVGGLEPQGGQPSPTT